MAVSVKRDQTPAGTAIAVEDVEIQLLLDGLAQITGFNFRDYDPALVKRRIGAAMLAENSTTVSALQDKVLHEPESLERLLTTLTVRHTPMFANAEALRTLRSLVVPMLRTYPFLRIWHIGCGNSEETYSLAILLAEEGLYERSMVYATDALESVIDSARKGAFPDAPFAAWTDNYMRAGGHRSLGDYVADHTDGTVVLDPAIRKNIVFAQHSVVCDASFNEFHLIVGTQVLSQFNLSLQSRVQRLIHTSLIRLGFLVIGDGESMDGSPFEQHYRRVGNQTSIYRRVQ